MRERLFKLLFRVEFNPKDEMAEQETFFFDSEENTGSEEENAWISGKFNRIIEKLDEIDQALNERVQGWNTERMGKVDLTILRLAVYEVIYDESIPTGVAINEAEIWTGFLPFLCKWRAGEICIRHCRERFLKATA